MADDDQPFARPAPEPVYEPIGRGAGSAPWEDDDDGVPEPVPGVRLSAGLVLLGPIRTLGSVRFWTLAAGTTLGTWAAAAAAVMVLAPIDRQSDWFDAALLVYALAATLLPAAAAFLAVHWGMACYERCVASPEREVIGAIRPALLATAVRGLALAALVFCVLQLQALLAGAPNAVAVAAAGVVAVEGLVFGAMGVGIMAAVRDGRRGRAAGWALAGVMVAGSAGAAAAMVPWVRAVEPVTVAVNVQWGPGGTRVAYQCSSVGAGVAEVHHTERIMWLAAASPSVVLLALGTEADPAGAVLGWVPAALQEAADGTQVPCVHGEPRAKDAPGTPLALVGVGFQVLVAGALLAAGRTRAARIMPGRSGGPRKRGPA